MAKETKQTKIVSACEQYVVDELKQAKKELAELKEELRFVKGLHQSLLRTVNVIAKNITIDSESSDMFHNIYVRGHFVDNLWKDIKKNDKDAQDFYYALLEIVSAPRLTQKGE